MKATPPPFPIPATFDQFLCTRPSWEIPLLELVQFQLLLFQFQARLRELNVPVTSTACGDMVTGNSKSFLQIVLDGSHREESMSFGWSFAFHNGQQIATCAGPGYGQPTSHRAESYGVLSASLFLTRLQTFLQISEPWKVRFVSDNQGLITRLRQREQYTYLYPNSTLEPDWDVVECITSHLRDSQIIPEYEHVTGHQDANVPYDQLDLDAQMNVDADALAGEYHADFPSGPRKVLFLPTTGTQFHIDQRTISGHYYSHIRAAAGTPAYIDYLQSKNAWDDATWQLADRITLRRVIARHSDKYVNVVKLIHDLLPTSAIRVYSDPTVTEYCELCHTQNSTFAHLIRCPHPTRHLWRQQLLEAIQVYCERTTTRLGLLQVIVAGLRAWFSGQTLQSCQYPRAFRHAIDTQNKLGWHGFLHGFCTSEWSRLQHAHYQHNDLVTNSRTGITWMVSLVSTIWTHLFELRTSYKELVHGADCKAAQATALRQIQTKIRMLHTKAATVRADDQRWLLPDLEDYLARSNLSTLQRWYATYEPVILDAIRLTTDTSTANTRSLRSYFPPIKTPPHLHTQASRPHRPPPKVHDTRT